MTLAKCFPFRRPPAAPRLRLICLPFAGGAASMYRLWVERFGPAVDVCPVELPGRGVRMAEPPLRDMKRLCEVLAEDLTALMADGTTTAFFGHSMGARIAFELSCRFAGRVKHLFASGSAAPDVAPRLGATANAKPIAQLTDAEFRARLRELGGTPRELLDDDELMERVLPVVRADFVLVERYRAAPQAQVSIPITAFRGADDYTVAPADSERWELRTTSAFRFLEVPGGHFFLDEQRELMIREVAKDLAPLLG
jgi:medium-chain acyl-[acyl-carrier-protein] hydrolase